MFNSYHFILEIRILFGSFPSQRFLHQHVHRIMNLYSLIRFLIFSLIGVLFLVCLFVCFVYACADD
jgi:hypothetical protein